MCGEAKGDTNEVRKKNSFRRIRICRLTFFSRTFFRYNPFASGIICYICLSAAMSECVNHNSLIFYSFIFRVLRVFCFKCCPTDAYASDQVYSPCDQYDALLLCLCARALMRCYCYEFGSVQFFYSLLI